MATPPLTSKVWNRALRECADPERARHHLDQLAEAGATRQLEDADARQASALLALLAGSLSLSKVLIDHPDWLDRILDLAQLEHPRQEQGLRREMDDALNPLLDAKDYPAGFRLLREFKQREMLRIATRDLAGFGDVADITREISNVADVCLDGVFELCQRQLSERFGGPFHQDPDGNWRPTTFCVMGMGKLGGQELNYSSDVDVIFVYDDEGHVFKQTPRKGKLTGKSLSNHQFFNRFAEAFIAEVSRLAPEGSLYRIDLRLRPEGDAGPLTRSLAGYENYYAQWGQTWERMMLIKARRVAGDRALAGEFLETIHPFRYPRSLGERVLREVAAMKQRIEEEVLKAGEVERNVKLGRGGIREIEFIIQTMQLLHAGRQPFLQGAQSLPLLDKLAQYKILPEEDTHRLAEAYRFLRQVEHRLQMEDDRQTHTLPQDKRALERLARLMRFPAATEFETERARHTDGVRAIYGRLLQAPESRPDELLPRDIEGHETRWKELLAGHGFQDVDKALHLTRMFMQGPGYLHFSSRTLELARLLFPKLLELCPTPDRLEKLAGDDHKILSDPDRVLARLDSFIRAYGARATLYETWAGNPSLFELWLLLFDRSEYLAEIAIRTPDLVDELELSGRLRRQKAAGDTLADLRYGLEDKDQRLWLRRYHQTELMRIGLRDILGLADFEHNLDELTALADACLAYAMEVVQHRHRLKAPPFCVAGLGKLGGREINYGSDLDVVFIADAKVGDLPKLQPLATEIMHLLSSTTEYGVAFQLDARLRPDGEKGLMVNTLAAYEDYYRHRAMLWEIQSLTRVRAVAGDLKSGRAFEKLAAKLTNFSKPSRPLAVFTGEWMAQIARMRERIEKERTPAGKDHLAIKTGCGGLIDAEFVAQAMCLRHGWQEANTLRALERLRGSDHLSSRNADQLITSYRKIRRIEGILRRWSFVGETVLPDDPAPLHRVALRCGFEGTDSFMKALGASRQALRQVYDKVFDSRPKPARSRKK